MSWICFLLLFCYIQFLKMHSNQCKMKKLCDISLSFVKLCSIFCLLIILTLISTFFFFLLDLLSLGYRENIKAESSTSKWQSVTQLSPPLHLRCLPTQPGRVIGWWPSIRGIKTTSQQAWNAAGAWERWKSRQSISTESQVSLMGLQWPSPQLIHVSQSESYWWVNCCCCDGNFPQLKKGNRVGHQRGGAHHPWH